MNKIRLDELFAYQSDGSLVRKVKTSNRTKVGDIVGWMDDNGYLLVRVDGAIHKVHRLIFLMHYGWLPQEVDHINGIRSDNRIDNLRPASKAENKQNAKLSRRNTSGVKGVSWCKRRNKWKAYICVKSKLLGLGHFEHIEDAKEAVKTARNEHHGEFANHG